MKSYWEIAFDYLLKYGKITNQDVIQITSTNCPHSVIRDMKKHGVKLNEITEQNNGKKYKVYFYAGFEGKKPKIKIQTESDLEPINQIALNLGVIAKIKETENEKKQRMLKKFGYC